MLDQSPRLDRANPMCLQPRTPIMLACASLIVACSLAVTLLPLPEVLQRAAWARQAWMLVGLQVVPLGVTSIFIGLGPAAFVTKPLAEIDRAVRRYACDETDVIPIYHSDQIGALGRNLNADAAAGQKAGAGQSGRRTAGTVLIFSRN